MQYKYKNDAFKVVKDIDFTQLASTDLGVAAGTKTIGGLDWTLVNSGGFLAADPNGLYITNGTGLIMASSAVSSVPDFNPANLTANLQIDLSSLVPELYAAGTNRSDLMEIFSTLYVGAIYEVTTTGNNQWGLPVNIGDGWSRGMGAGSGQSGGVASVFWNQHTAAYTEDSTAASTMPPLTGKPTACIMSVHNNSQAAYFGMANDLSYPKEWATSSYAIVGSSVLANGLGSAFGSSARFGIGIGDATAAGGCVLTLKRLTFWVPKFAIPHGVTITGSEA